MRDYQVFTHENFGIVRVRIWSDEQPWFVAVDICNSLKLSSSRDAICRRVDGEDRIIFSYNDWEHEELLINIPGMYWLIFLTNTTESRKFKTWMTSKVIPNIKPYWMTLASERSENIAVNQ